MYKILWIVISTLCFMQQCLFFCSTANQSTVTQTERNTLFFSEPMLHKPPVSVYLYGWAPGCDQQTQSWTAWHPLRCPCFPPIHSSIISKAPSAWGFYTNTCSLIYNSQWPCRHPRLGITHVDNSSGACILGSKRSMFKFGGLIPGSSKTSGQ